MRRQAYLRAVERVPSSAFFSAISSLVASRSCSGMRGFCSFFRSSSALPAQGNARLHCCTHPAMPMASTDTSTPSKMTVVRAVSYFLVRHAAAGSAASVDHSAHCLCMQHAEIFRQNLSTVLMEKPLSDRLCNSALVMVVIVGQAAVLQNRRSGRLEITSASRATTGEKCDGVPNSMQADCFQTAAILGRYLPSGTCSLRAFWLPPHKPIPVLRAQALMCNATDM